MNNNVNHKKVLAELKNNIEIAGMPEFTDFSELCEYVRDFLIRRHDFDRDDEINYGYCFVWAYLVWALWPKGGITFVSVTGHVVVKYDGTYWDAEHCHGEKDLLGFCSFSKWSNPKHLDVRWMCWYWTRAGKAKRELRRLLRAFDPRTYKLVRNNGKDYWKNTDDDFPSYSALDKITEVA